MLSRVDESQNYVQVYLHTYTVTFSNDLSLPHTLGHILLHACICPYDYDAFCSFFPPRLFVRARFFLACCPNFFSIQAICVVPTFDLCMQTARVIERMAEVNITIILGYFFNQSPFI
jgi:hypothetical protein